MPLSTWHSLVLETSALSLVLTAFYISASVFAAVCLASDETAGLSSCPLDKLAAAEAAAAGKNNAACLVRC